MNLDIHVYGICDENSVFIVAWQNVLKNGCETMTYCLNVNAWDCLCRLKDIKLYCGKTHLNSVTQWTHMLVMQIMRLRDCA